MKKLILGVILCASSSFMLANNAEVKKLDQPQSFKSNCFAQVVINFETPCGEYVYSASSPKYSVNCQQGQAEGSTSTYYEVRQIDGWNPGTGPNPATSCP